MAISHHPDNFKFTTPFMIGQHGILINTSWGKNKKHHVLLLDNFSPSWLKKSVLEDDKMLLKPTRYNFNTSTASGKAISGQIGVCDSLVFGETTFSNAPFYIINSEPDDRSCDGVLGSELMERGIWKIDFKNSLLTFTSSIDSLPESAVCEPLICSFGEGKITMSIKFLSGKVERASLDLGFNGEIMLANTDSDYLYSKAKAYTDNVRISTPSENKIVASVFAFDTIQIGHHWFNSVLSTTASTTDRLVGIKFFRRFNFIIIDFKHNKLLVPKMVF